MNILALVAVVLPLAACQLIGGPTSVDVNRDDVQQIASFALTQLNTLLGSQDNTLVSVVQAKTQVVAGINYILTLEIKNRDETQTCTVTVWFRVWLNDKQVTHHACTSRTKRDGLLGAQTSANVTRTDILKMATYAVTTLNGLQGTHNSLDQVISAKTQVVAGTNYILKIRMSDGGLTQICDVTIWDQPWSYMTQMTHHSCVNAKRRDIGMPGGLTNADVNSPDVKNITNFALGELNRLQGAQNSIVDVISAKTQVVAGINYFLKIRMSDGSQTQICDVTIWDQPWTHMTQMTHHSCVNAKRRDILLPGGLTNADVNSTEVRDMADFALGEINGLQGAQNSIVDVISAKTQVVSGMNYMLTIRLKEGYKTQICYVRIWSQPWLNRKEMTEHSCSQVTKRAGSLLGGIHSVSVNSGDIKQVAKFAVTEINGIQGVNNSLVKVVKAGYQVVDALIYVLTLSLRNGNNTQLCEVRVWSPAWTKERRLTDHHCTAKTKRQLRAVTDADVNDHFIQMLAHYAVQTTNALDGTNRTYVELISAKTQVVAGTNYFFKIRVREGTTTQICYVRIWSQPWLNRKEMTEHSCSQVTKRARSLLGDVISMNVNSGDIKQVAKYAVTQINGIQGVNNSLVNVVKAGYQVVGGFTYVLTLSLRNGNNTQLCEVRVWSPSWTMRRNLTDYHCTGQIKRQLAAVTDADVNDHFIQMLAHYAVQTTNALDGTNRTYVELISAKTQVVAGTNYFFKIRVREGTTTKLCDITFWRQVWMNSIGHVTEHKCTTISRRSLGDVDPTQLSASLQQAVSFAEDALNGKMNNMFRFVVEKVENIPQKAAWGTKYSFDLHLVSSTCRNNGNSYGKGIADCTPNYAMLQRMTCEVTVVYRPSSSRKYSLASDSCGQMQFV